MTYNRKLQLLWLLTHAVAIWALITNFSFLWLLIAYGAFVLFKPIGGEIGAHRYFVHKSFTTSKAKENFLLWVQTFAGEGSILSWCGVHRQHHAYTEQEKDPHSPHTRKWWKVMYWLDPIKINPRFVLDHARNKAVMFQHNHYFKIHALTFLLISGLFGVHVYAYVIAIPVVMSLYTNAAINIVCHLDGVGYRNFETREQSRNVGGLFNVFMMGGGLHNNHHHKPSSYTNKVLDSEQDLLGWIIKKVFIT